jgi:hypothetical protein
MNEIEKFINQVETENKKIPEHVKQEWATSQKICQARTNAERAKEKAFKEEIPDQTMIEVMLEFSEHKKLMKFMEANMMSIIAKVEIVDGELVITPVDFKTLD